MTQRLALPARRNHITQKIRIARLMSIALQYGAPLEKVGDLLADAKFAPCGPVSGHDRLKHCSSLPDLIGRHLLVEYCGRHELSHVPETTQEEAHHDVEHAGKTQRS